MYVFQMYVFQNVIKKEGCFLLFVCDINTVIFTLQKLLGSRYAKQCILVISEDPSLNVEKESHEFRLILYHAYMYIL